MTLQPGQRVDRYRVEEVVSDGEFAEVYRVTHVEIGSSHALKLLAAGASEADQAALREEGRILAALAHPNLVRATDAIAVEGQPGLVLDWVNGPSLADFLANRREPLGVPAALGLFDGVLGGVGHAHRCGVLHRDLKPENILLARTSSGLVPRVADFGMAIAFDPPGPTPSPPRRGTPEYLAPELHSGEAVADPRADLFALGAILYELLTGALPFDGDSPAAVLATIRAGQFTDTLLLRRDLPETIAAMVRTLLASNPDNRPASAEVVRRALATIA